MKILLSLLKWDRLYVLIESGWNVWFNFTLRSEVCSNQSSCEVEIGKRQLRIELSWSSLDKCPVLYTVGQ